MSPPATKDDSAAKKRKTSSSSSSAGAAAGGGDGTELPDRAALYVKVSKLEEDESRAGDPDSDAVLFAKTSDSINKILDKVYELKTKKAKTAAAPEIAELRTEV